MGTAQVHRAGDRFVSRSRGVQTRHSLSFGPHYDPANTSFGRLVLHDEHRLDPHAGFPPHPHAGVEVVSWVLEGRLVHEDPAGRVHELGPGALQHLSTGSGTVHVERAAGEPTRVVQAWLLGEGPPAAPSYALVVPEPGPPVPVLQVGSAVLHAGRLPAGGTLAVGGDRLVHAFVASGQAGAAGAHLSGGDAVRWSGPDRLVVTAAEDCDLLVWEMPVTRAQE